MSINYKKNLENNKDNSDGFEKTVFSFDYIKIGNRITLFILIFFFTIVMIAAFKIKAETVDDLPVVVQELVPPPFVPVHNQVADEKAKVVKVTMIVEEKIIEIDDEGTQFRVFAF
ncbi:uncharacterized protein METZ01_LOCUS219389, partial [marine metagenome]